MSHPTDYTAPTDPADPEAAAYELIVKAPVAVLGAQYDTDPLRVILQDFAGMLHAEDTFTGLTWHDAQHCAAAIAIDSVTRDDGADFLRNRARNALSGADGMPWDDREGVARALNIGATVLGE